MTIEAAFKHCREIGFPRHKLLRMPMVGDIVCAPLTVGTDSGPLVMCGAEESTQYDSQKWT